MSDFVLSDMVCKMDFLSLEFSKETVKLLNFKSTVYSTDLDPKDPKDPKDTKDTKDPKDTKEDPKDPKDDT